MYPHTEPSPLSFLVPYSEFCLTLERERESLCDNLLLEILSVHIISFEDFCKKTKAKKISHLLHPLHLTCCLFDFTCCQQRLFRI
jgi:hypothetical protein